MAKTKKKTTQISINRWLILFLVVFVLAGAVYTVTALNKEDKNLKSLKSAQKDANNSLKVDTGPSDASDVNNNPIPAQSASTTEGGQNMQPSASSGPVTDYNNDYPSNPSPMPEPSNCPRPGIEIACIQY